MPWEVEEKEGQVGIGKMGGGAGENGWWGAFWLPVIKHYSPSY